MRKASARKARKAPGHRNPGNHLHIHHTQGPPPFTSSGKPAPFAVLGARGNELIPAPLLEIQTRRPRASWLAQTADRIPQAIQAHAPRLRVRVAVDGAARSRAARYPSLTKENIGLRRAIFGATFFFFPCSRGSVVPGRVARLLNNAPCSAFLRLRFWSPQAHLQCRPLGAHWAQACCSRAEWAKRVGRTNL